MEPGCAYRSLCTVYHAVKLCASSAYSKRSVAVLFTKRKASRFLHRQKTYYIMLAAEILLFGESVYRVVRYFSWTVAKIRTPGINTWYDGIMPIAPTLIPVLIFALALLILGILQFLSAKKKYLR